MKIATVALSTLKVDKRNARKHNQRNIDEIKRSLEGLGQHRPFVVQKDTMRILIGNGMWQAMKELGWKEAQAIFVDDDDATATRRALADNRTAELAEWDDEVLKSLIEELGPDPNVPGWADEELSDMFDLYCFGDGDSNEDAIPKTIDAPISKTGDIWILGEHRLICGDACDNAVIEKLMCADRADMVFTDPPYNVNYAAKNEFLNEVDKGNRIQTEIKNDHFDSDQEIGEKLWKPVFMLMAEYAHDHCSIYVTMPQGGAHMMMMMMMIAASWQVKHELIWVKNNHVLGRTDYYYKHEPMMFGWKKKHHFYGKGQFDKSVWEIDKPLKNDLHPTMKPVALIENAILNSSKKDDIVSDFFGGSGSTLIACEKTGRKCRMCEISPEYVDVIVERWQNFTGKEAILEGCNESFNTVATSRSPSM